MQRGFTLIESLIALFILIVLAGLVVGAFVALQKQSNVDGAVQELATVIAFAQSKTLASENSSQYGVYFDAAPNPHRYILFKGATYATRDTSYDKITSLPSALEFFSISLGGGNEVNFARLTGISSQSGSVSVRVKTDTAQAKTLYISSAGTVSFTAPTAPADTNRVKDSRHVRVDYSRVIATATENLVLNFNNGGVIQTIPIASNMSSGQIDWTGTISVSGADQVVRVHTHRLNNPDTQFSIHRDRRYNTVSLKVSLSGDSANFAEYSADGLTTTYPSFYASNGTWQ